MVEHMKCKESKAIPDGLNCAAELIRGMSGFLTDIRR